MSASRVVMATAVSAAISLATAGVAVAENTTLYVKNNTGGYLTVNVDGVYGCNTSAGSTCSIPVTVGSHDLHAHRSDTGDTRTCTSKYIGANTWTWTPWPTNNCS